MPPEHFPSRRLLDSLFRIKDLCDASSVPTTPVQQSGIIPNFPAKRDDWFLTAEDVPDTFLRRKLVYLAQTTMGNKRRGSLVLYDDAVKSLVSLEAINGMTDTKLERHMCKLFESDYHQFAAIVKTRLLCAVGDDNSRERTSKTNSFPTIAVCILEAAFAKSQSLTTRECTLVAEAAGISHQQVRTWFQNKRNRGNKSRRAASTSDLNNRVTERVVPERRVFSGLPRRSQQKVNTDEGLDVPARPTRPVRGLPNRKSITPAESPAESTTTSLDSIPSSGGFLSPLNVTTSSPPIITFPVDFDVFPQHARWTGNGNGIMESPMDMSGLMPWDGSFNFDLGNFEQSIQAVLDGPTLGGSPALSYGASTVSDGNPIDTPEDEYLKLGLSDLDGDELLQMLNNAEYISSEEMLVDCADANGNAGANGEWSSMGGSGEDLQTEETMVTVEEVGSSWSGSSGRSTPSLVESLPGGQAPPIFGVSAVGNIPAASTVSPSEQTPCPAQEQQQRVSGPAVLVTGPAPSPGAVPTQLGSQVSYAPQPPQQYLQYAQHPPMDPQTISVAHVHPSYYSHAAAYQPEQVEHIYFAAPPPQIYYAAPYPPQAYPPLQQESTWITGALPFDNVYAQQSVPMSYGPTTHEAAGAVAMYPHQVTQGQVVTDGGAWAQ